MIVIISGENPSWFYQLLREASVEPPRGPVRTREGQPIFFFEYPEDL